MLQIQSTPGVLVAATSKLADLERWLEPVRGIVIDHCGAARLVTQIVTPDGRDVQTRRGADAKAIVESFLSAVTHELLRRARFNRAVDLRTAEVSIAE